MSLGLPRIERESFLKALDVTVREGHRNGDTVGLMLIDLSNLSRINHSYGFDKGDSIVAEAHDALLGVTKLSDTVFRSGGRQFAYILPGLNNPAFIALAMNRVKTLLEDALMLGDGVMPIQVRIGVAVNKGSKLSALDMLAAAELSLADAKKGRERNLEDLLGMEPPSEREIELERLFYESLHNNAFQLYYQPKINLHTGRPDSAEALLRWQLEDGSFISPEYAVNLAENSGRGYALAKWVVHRAMRQAKEWRDTMDVQIAVNIQASLVANPDLHGLVKDSLAIWGVSPDKFALEITEGGFIEDKESGFNNLLNLRELGTTLSIDDFGTGYSSLSYFKHIPADELKIDKSFIDNLIDGGHDLELVKIMIYIAHQFDLTVVAEGVEDRATCDLLKALGCDYIQGYYFSKPLSVDNYEAWMRENKDRSLI
jgi:diguanylate cyclase (GGDEF)-like protein